MDFEGFYAYIRPSIPGVDDDFIRVQLQDTVQDFLILTELVTQRVQPISTVVGVDTYTLTLSSGEFIPYRVKTAWYDGIQLDPMAQDQFEGMMVDRKRYAKGRPLWYTQPAYNKIQLFPVPDESKTDIIEAAVSVTTTHDAPVVPDELVPHRHAIIAGTRARLYTSNNPAFANPQLGSVEWQKYGSYVENIAHRARRSYSAGLQVKPRKWL